MPESVQHKLDRVRPPRVQITYDVEIGDAIVMKELPFVVGIMADLSGMSDKVGLSADRPDPTSLNGKKRPQKDPVKPKPLKDRKYMEIDRDNFSSVMEFIAPRLVFPVKNQKHREYTKAEYDEYRKKKKLREDDKLPTMYKPDEEAGTQLVELEFLSLDDFDPINIVRQVKFLRELLETRNHLSDLLTKLDGNDELEKQLQEIIKQTDRAKAKAIRDENQAAAAVKKAEEAVQQAATQQAADAKEVTDAKTKAAEAQKAAEDAQQAAATAQALADAKKRAAEAQATLEAQNAATAAQKAAAAQKAVEQAQAVAAAQKAADDAKAAADKAQKDADEAQKAADAKKGKK